MLSHKEGSKLHDKIAGAYSHSIDMMEDLDASKPGTGSF